MKIEMWPIDKPIPYDRNPRLISDKAINEVANSISEAGIRQPIVVNKDGVIIVGHTRIQACKKLGIKEVPVHIADLTAEQEKDYRVRDNKSGEFSDWDMDMLAVDFNLPNLEVMGFDEKDLEIITDINSWEEENEAIDSALSVPKKTQRFDMSVVCAPEDIEEINIEIKKTVANFNASVFIK